MIKKHPQDRAERLAINEKKKKDKRKNIEGVYTKSFSTLPSDIETRTDDNGYKHPLEL